MLYGVLRCAVLFLVWMALTPPPPPPPGWPWTLDPEAWSVVSVVCAVLLCVVLCCP